MVAETRIAVVKASHRVEDIARAVVEVPRPDAQSVQQSLLGVWQEMKDVQYLLEMAYKYKPEAVLSSTSLPTTIRSRR